MQRYRYYVIDLIERSVLARGTHLPKGYYTPDLLDAIIADFRKRGELTDSSETQLCFKLPIKDIV